MMELLAKLSKIDRKVVFLMVAAAVIIPFLFPTEFPMRVTPEAQKMYDAVEALPDGSNVLLTFDMYAQALAETEPMSRAVLHQLWRKNCKIVTVSTIPFGGPSVAERVTRNLAAEYNKTYGVDFVNLGYKPNYVSVLRGMGTSIESIYPADNSGTPLSELPLMQSVKNYNDVKYIVVIADNGIIDYWISIVRAQYSIPMSAGVTAVMAPKQYAYFAAGQLDGLLGGMKGAAEYEKLVGKPGLAITGMGAQSIVHFLIIFLVLIGNIGYFVGRRLDAEKGIRS